MHTENEAAGRPRVDLEAQLQGLPTILLMCILIHTLSQTCQKREGLSLLGEAGGVGEKDTSRCAASREQSADRKEEGGGGGGGGDDECDGGSNNDETNKRGKKAKGSTVAERRWNNCACK